MSNPGYLPPFPNQQAQTTRRPTYDGDYVRGAGAGEGLETYLRYQVEVPEDLESSLFLSRPVGYNAIKIWWGPPADIEVVWSRMAIVRSGFGYPITPADGEVIVFVDRYVDASSEEMATAYEGGEMNGSMVDADLPAGRWYYYSLLYQVGTKWYRAATTADLVPIDYAHRDSMYDQVPPFYKMVDSNYYGGTDNSVLMRLFETLGYELDYTRTLAEQMEVLYDVDQAPSQLLGPLGKYNIGFVVDEDAIGTIRYRSLLGANRQLVDKRGTADGLAEYIQAVSKYPTTAKAGTNIMLLHDDSEFHVGTGNWCPMPWGISQALLVEELDLPDYGNTWDTSVSGRVGLPTLGLTLEQYTPSGVGDDVVPTSDITGNVLTTRGVLKVTADANTPLAISCGAGQQNDVVGNIPETATPDIDFVHLNPEYRGVPIEEGEVYYFSFWETQYNTISTASTETAYGLVFFDRDPTPTEVTTTAGVGSGLATLDLSGLVVVNWEDLENKYCTIAGVPALITNHTGAGVFDILPASLTVNAADAVVIDFRESTPFSDAFWGAESSGSSFATYAEVTPLSIADNLVVAADDAGSWTRRSMSVQAPVNARFAVPVIWVYETATGNPLAHTRYFTGMMVSKSQGLGIEQVFQPSQYFTLGEDDLGDGPTNKVLAR